METYNGAFFMAYDHLSKTSLFTNIMLGVTVSTLIILLILFFTMKFVNRFTLKDLKDLVLTIFITSLFVAFFVWQWFGIPDERTFVRCWLADHADYKGEDTKENAKYIDELIAMLRDVKEGDEVWYGELKQGGEE